MTRRALEFAFYALGPVVALVTTPFLARALGAEDRGLLGVVLAISSVAVTAGNWGQAEVFLSKARGAQWEPRLASMISFSCAIVAACCAVPIMMALGVPFLPSALAGLAIPALAAGNLWRSISIAKQRVDLPAYANGLSASLRLLLIPALALTSYLSLPTAVAMSQFALVVGYVVTTGRFARAARTKEKSLSWRRARSALAAGTPIIAFNMLTSVTINSGVILTQILSTPHQVGLFAACFALSQSALAVSAAFKTRIQTALFSEHARRLVYRELGVLAAIGGAGALTVGLLASPITLFLLGPEFSGADRVLQILALGTLGQLLLDSMHGIQVGLGRRSSLILTGSTGAAIALTTMCILVPTAGAMGAAVGVSAGYWGAAIVGLLVVRKGLREA